MELLPDPRPRDAFYFQPLKKPPTTWFTNKPVGHHTLRNTLSRLCKTAGITGYKSNHSLRATAATRLYQSGVDEQLVMERTGHRSLEGIRSYKRTSDMQRKAVSDILNSKRPCTEGNSVCLPTNPSTTKTEVQPPLSSNTTNLQANIQNTIRGAFYFNSCSSITII